MRGMQSGRGRGGDGKTRTRRLNLGKESVVEAVAMMHFKPPMVVGVSKAEHHLDLSQPTGALRLGGRQECGGLLFAGQQPPLQPGHPLQSPHQHPAPPTNTPAHVHQACT